MTELYLVRHGQTEENAAHILQGHMPGHLSHEGIAQAQALRDELKNIRFDALLCSDLKRCMDTAMILNEPHGLPLGLCRFIHRSFRFLFLLFLLRLLFTFGLPYRYGLF